MSSNVPVALIFFARPDLLKQTFSAIRQNKPQKLFLIQDGPRPDKPDDIIKIQKCRDIVEHIDWDCKVYRNYSDVNLGCGKRVSTGVTWAFEHVDRLAIIEDDCVPSEGFFAFCSEVLERYCNDERVDMISGMNNLEVYEETQYDYFFSESGSIWGWATWKRVWDKIDFNLDVVDDPYATKLLIAHCGKQLVDDCIKMRQKIAKGIKMSSWTLQRCVNMYLNSGLIVVPKRNLITNIGLSEDGANSVSSIKMIPRGMRQIYFMRSYSIELPLKHPPIVMADNIFTKKLDRVMGSSGFLQRRYRRIESLFYRLIYKRSLESHSVINTKTS
jgi:hypothetical protein